MPRGGFSGRYLTRLHSPIAPAERLRVEIVLAAARVFLTVATAVALFLDSTEPARYAHITDLMVKGYVAYSMLLLLLLLHQRKARRAFWIQTVDIVFPAVIMMFSEGPESPLFFFFVFSLTAAAARWGWPETVTTASCAVILVSSQALMLFPLHWLAGEYEINRFVIRIAYLVGFAVLVGYLGEEQKLWHAESDTVGRALAKAQVELGLRATLQAVCEEFLRLFEGRRIVIVLHQGTTGRVFVWRSFLLPDGGNNIVGEEISVSQRARYAAPLPVATLFAQRRGSRWAVWGVDAEGEKAHLPAGFDPASIPETEGVASLLAISLSIGPEWSGALVVLDGNTGRDRYKEIRFGQKLLERVGPACYTVYLLRRLRQRAGAMERARVARELHDGTLQELIALEMEVDILRRQVARGLSHDTGLQLQQLQDRLRHEVAGLRTLMQQMKPVEVTPAQLLDYLSDRVERFRRDTGINAQFVSGLEEVSASPHTCREIVRIVQEALVNVRKHSGARNVLLRLAAEAGNWKLVIEDDGRGFDFSGSLDLSALDGKRRGPEVIKERVRMLGGTLRIHSNPGQGAQLEITLPQKAHVAYV
jgi:signal transduction histidine kinase